MVWILGSGGRTVPVMQTAIDLASILTERVVLDVPGAGPMTAYAARPAHPRAGVLVAHEVARAFGVRGLFTERQDGAMVLRRGFALEPGERAVVVEDVITTGGSTREVMDAVRGLGGVVEAVGCLIDRSGGVDLGVPMRSLVKLDVPTYRADACPLCAAGGAPVKPGSRGMR